MRCRYAVILMLSLSACDGDVAPTGDAAAEIDCGLDAGADAGPDATPDMQPRPDRALDAASDPDGSPPDATLDATVDAEVDATLDAEADVMPDAEADAAPPDALPDRRPLPDLGPPREQCFGGVDDDGDGLIDCADPDCRPSASCFEAREDCANGVDDDGDLRADCADRYCLADPGCPPPDVAPFTAAELQARFDFECAECHGPVDPFSSLDLSAPFEEAVVDVQSVQVPLPLIKPGARDESFLYLKITFRHLEVGGDGEGMPPAFEGYPPWSAEEAERLGRWIDGLGTQ